MDFIPCNLTSSLVPTDYINWFVKKYYHTDTHKNYFYGLNLIWPTFDLPLTVQKYIISFHTEYINVDWIIEQAQKVYPKPLMLITDYEISSNTEWPDNITHTRYITIHHQLKIASHVFGVETNPVLPDYKISSMSMRISQYKAFVTAYLLQNFELDEAIISYHNRLNKDEDLHSFPMLNHLKKLNLNLKKTFVNIDDESQIINESPLSNANWHVPAYTNALINLTNESFHYSKTVKNKKDFVYPGPYLTDKTFKPLLAGRPFIPVGQAGTIRFLNEVGFKTDFGIDLSYDHDTGDLSRIKGVFDAIDIISQNSIDKLYESSIISVKHNSRHILSGTLFEVCNNLNKCNVDSIQDWHA